MKTEKNEKAVNTRIPTATWEWLTSIGTAGGVMKAVLGEAMRASKAGIEPWKLAESITELQMIRRRSQGELKGIFTPSEWCYMADSLNGTIVTAEFRCVPSALVASIEDSDLYDGLGAKWDVDVKELCSKVEKLTAAQVDATFTRIEAFWDSADEERVLDDWAKW